MHNFSCSQRTVDIDNPEEFHDLCGDELSELLCEDPKFINWFNEEDIIKMSGHDIIDAVIMQPSLFPKFEKRLQDKRITRQRNWDYLLSRHPQFHRFNPHDPDNLREQK